ncbi:MAG: hypothetical protein WDM96_06805 [Lacunisphaera sp.]
MVCANVLTFVAPGACGRALRQIVRAMKPGGRVLLIIPALESHDAVVAFETAARRRGGNSPRSCAATTGGSVSSPPTESRDLPGARG